MVNRRKFLGSLAGAVCAATLPISQLKQVSAAIDPLPRKNPDFKYCLNTSTISGQKSGLWANIEIVAKAGYNGIELWLNDIQRYLKEGGSKGDLKNKIRDSGLSFENAIGFSEWIVDDTEVRNRAIDQLKGEMELLAELGCRRIAAPPSGATQGKILNLFDVAERYRAILKIGEGFGIIPILEIWGASVNIYSLSQAAFVIIESKHPDACMLPDIYHLHRSGSEFTGLRYLNKDAISMFHLNDYPAVDDLTRLKDSNRVFPGDGTAPFPFIMKELRRINPEMVLSLELFNAEYWKMDALDAARLGLQKMKKVSQA